jgi:hypothetical protein
LGDPGTWRFRVSHIDHVRVAWVLHGRHGPVEAEERLVEGTRKGCDYYGVPEKFDEHLTRRWARPVSDAVADAPESESSRTSSSGTRNFDAAISSGSPARCR